MNPVLLFAAAAVLMTAAALAAVLHVINADASLQGRRLRWSLGLGLPLAAALLYTLLGDPAALSPARVSLSARLQGLPPPADSTAHAEISDDALYTELQHHLQRNPGDARALILRGRLDLQAERYTDAVAAYQQALAGNSKATRDAGVWLEYAEAVGLAQGGRLAGQPQELIAKALSLAPDNPKALDLAGSAALERGDHAQAQRHWQALLEQLPPESPRHRELSMALDAVAQRAKALP